MFSLIKNINKSLSFKQLIRNPIQYFSCKICRNSHEAIKDIQDGASIIMGGFGLGGIPENSIQALNVKGVKNITVYTNTGGVPTWGLGILLSSGQIKKMYASYVGENPLFEKMYLEGQLEVVLTPQGTLAEKLRCGSAGIAAFYTPTGVGTYVEEGKIPKQLIKGSIIPSKTTRPKEREYFNGKPYIMEYAVQADFALLKAKVADTAGNLIYYRLANNFNQDAAGAAKTVIAEVEEIVPEGTLDPDQIHTPGIYVDRIYKGEQFAKKIERLRYRKEKNNIPNFLKKRVDLVKDKIAARAAKELQDGMYVNLGIGIPTLVPSFLPEGVNIMLHTENGAIGVGPYPKPGEEHSEIINAGKETITLKKGASCFSSSTSFGIIRGGHLDCTILGSMQVSRDCSIANWIIPGKKVTGMGGAMDLAASGALGSRVIICMQHNTKKELKILEKCTLPITGLNVADTVITEKAVFRKINNELVLHEVAEEFTLDEVKECTGFKFEMVETSKIKTF